MAQIEAVYEGGVFRPLGEVHLRENQRVRLEIQPIGTADIQAWLEEVQQLHQAMIEKHGYLPDSTADIAADRVRDE
jgi:predicted DNA-binding antitoxin AbrB/MazE fold protein